MSTKLLWLSLWLGCGSSQPPAKTLLRNTSELRAASTGQSEARNMIAAGDRVRVAFRCVAARGPDVAALLDRAQVQAELRHAWISTTQSCDEATRCCWFVRERGLAKDQVSLDTACFRPDGRLVRVVMIDEDGCRG